MASTKHVRTLRVRVKDKHAAVLRRMACEVNTVWNYANETSARAWSSSRRWISGFDLDKLTTGSSKEFEAIGSSTVQETVHQFAAKRNKAKRARLRWRVSNPHSSRRSLGWVPFKARATKWRDGGVFFAGHVFGVWDSYGLEDYTFRAGCFSEDARGYWYFCVAVEVKEQEQAQKGTAVGIDLGLKEAATLSTGEASTGREYRTEEAGLAVAQRARKKKRIKAIHAKIKNRRKDRLHKLSTRVTREFATVVVGNVSIKVMTKKGKGFAKSVLDAGWYMFKTQLGYKASRRRGVFLEVDERYTTQTCSSCFARSGPKGLEGLVIREWSCQCGAIHDRDVNAAQNILALGLERLAVGIPVL